MKPVTRTLIQNDGSIECYVLDTRADEYNRILTWYPWCRRLHLSCANNRTRTTAEHLNMFCSDLNIPVSTRLEGGEFHSIEYNPPMSITRVRALADLQADPYETLPINENDRFHQFWSSGVMWNLAPLPQYGIAGVLDRSEICR